MHKIVIFASPKGSWPTDTNVGPSLQILMSVRRSVRPRFPKTPTRVAPIRSKIGGDVQRGRRMKAVKTLYEKVAPVPRKK